MRIKDNDKKIKIEKNNIIITVLFIIGGFVFSLGLETVFASCSTDKMVMLCHYSTVTVVVTSIFLFTAGITYIFADTLRTRITICIFVIETSIIDILIPKLLIGGCRMNTMRCRSITFPVIYLVSSIILVISVTNIIYLLVGAKKSSNREADE